MEAAHAETRNTQQKREPMYKSLPLSIPFLVIVLAESMFFFGYFKTTLALHGLNLLICTMLPLAPFLNPRLFKACSLVSVLRLLNIAMPVFVPYTIYWLPLIYGPILLTSYFTLKGHPSDSNPDETAVHWEELGLAWKPYYLPLGVILGLLIGNVEYQLLHPEALIASLSLANLALLGFVMVFFVGLVEEIIFRSLLQSRLRERVGKWWALLIASGIFATMHSGYASLQYLLFVFLVGVLFGFLFQKTQSLALVTLTHGSINFFLFSFLPYQFLLFF